MSVSVTKSGFNVREKLKQLQKPIGLKGSELMRAETAQEARDFVSAGRKNLIINGGMEVSQRGTGAGNAASAGQVVSCDQWKSWINGSGGSGAAFTLQQEFSVIPDNFITSLKVNQTGTATLSSSQYNLVANYIEGYRIAHLGFGTAAAKTVTLSFWIRSSITGTFGGALSNGAQNRSYPFSYTIDNVNTWERKKITIPGDTTGTWARDNSRGFLIFFSLGTGPGYSGPEGVWAGATYLSVTGVNNWVGQSSTFYLTGVQLEVGKNATEFEHRSYGEELALCQRYYYRVYGGRYEWRSSDYTTYRNGSLGSGSHPVTMRQAPTMGHNLTGDSTNINPSTVASPVGAWSWYSWATGWGTSSSINSGTIANWGLDPTTNGWAGGIYYISPSNYSHVTHMQISSQSYIEASAEL